MIFSIKWHEECLTNQTLHLARELAALQIQQARVDRLAESVTEYRDQIDLAVRKGKGYFDREQFNQKKKR